ncbi:plasmid recombination protein [Streptococcus suis]|nr:plasmid recombination protein [Streptococcus suis]
MELSISFKTSSKMTSLKHNNRELTEEEFLEPAHRHIDQTKINQNIYIRQENLKEVYDDIFGQALKDYNANQKRSDRKIDDFYHHVKKSKTLDLQREFIVSIGSKEDWDSMPENNREVAGKLLRDYLLDFEKRHSNLYVYNAVVHLDEAGSPHLHFNVVPVASGYKNGLKLKPSFKKALANEGYTQTGRYLLKEFRDKEIKNIEQVFKRVGVVRKLVGTNNIKDMHEYKNLQKELDDLKQEIEDKKDELDWIQTGIEEAKERREEIVKEFFQTHRQTEQQKEELKQLGNVKADIINTMKIDIQEEIENIKKDLPQLDLSGIEMDLAFAKEIGYDGIDDLILRNRGLSEKANSYEELFKKVKLVFQDVSLMNALGKVKEVLGLIKDFVPRGLTQAHKESLQRAKNQFSLQARGFNSRLDEVIANAKKEVEKLSFEERLKRAEEMSKRNVANYRSREFENERDRYSGPSL